MPKGVYPRKLGLKRPGRIRSTPMERLLDKLAITVDGCWLWHGTKNNMGYGKLTRGRRGEGLVYAHRLAYELFVGPIPEGLTIDHLCRTPACVNPQHLEPTTMRENHLRGIHNGGKTHCPQRHIYDERNTYYASNGDRHCRACGRTQARLRRKTVIDTNLKP